DWHVIGARRDRAPDGDEEGLPYLRFGRDAQDAFDGWRHDLEHRLCAGDPHPALESHLGKYRKLVPAEQLHCREAKQTCQHKAGPPRRAGPSRVPSRRRRTAHSPSVVGRPRHSSARRRLVVLLVGTRSYHLELLSATPGNDDLVHERTV